MPKIDEKKNNMTRLLVYENRLKICEITSSLVHVASFARRVNKRQVCQFTAPTPNADAKQTSEAPGIGGLDCLSVRRGRRISAETPICHAASPKRRGNRQKTCQQNHPRSLHRPSPTHLCTWGSIRSPLVELATSWCTSTLSSLL